jgi:hypothetical protein
MGVLPDFSRCAYVGGARPGANRAKAARFGFGEASGGGGIGLDTKRHYLLLAFFVMPAAASLSVTAQDLTIMLLGEKWQPAGLLLSIIALRGIFHVVEGSQPDWNLVRRK